MKKFRDILETVYPPKPGDEKHFMDKHIVDKKDNPNAAPGQFTSDKKKAKRIADYDEGEEEKVYEAAELHTKRADKEAVIVRAIDPKTGQSKTRVVKRSTGEIKIGEETDLDEKAVNPYAVGMAAAMKQAGDTPPLKKSTIVKGHEIAKSIKKEAMDPVGKHDADIDNDGDVDKSDKYLIKRRKAIARAVNEAVEVRHDRYMRSHGKKARDSGQGTGSWMFTHKNMGDVDYNNKKEVHTAQGKFADAKKSAQQWAKEHGHRSVYVMEEVELGEETIPGNVALRMVDMHKAAAAHHKKNRNMKGYAAHLNVSDRIEDAVKRAGRDMPIRSTQIDNASDKAFRDHPHRVVKSEEADLDEGHGVFLKGGSVGETRSGKPVEVHSNIEDAKAQAKRLNKNLSPGEKKHYGLKYHVKPVAEESAVDQIDEAFKVGAMHLEDGSSITLTREDVDTLNNLFNQLNSSNKSKMEQRLKSSKNGFNEIITFAKEVV